MPRKKTSTTKQSGFSYIPPEKRRAASWRDLPIPPDGANESPIESFSHIASFVLANMQTFSVFDFVNLLKAQGITFAQIQPIFARWVQSMVVQCRVQTVPSCYDVDVFKVV